MFYLLVTSLALGHCANLFAWGFAPLQRLKARLNLRYELLDCSLCAGFWLGTLAFCLTGYWQAPFLTSLFAGIIERKLRYD